MTSRIQKSLVIDSDVTSSASEKPEKVAASCHDFLEAVRQCGHRIVFTPIIMQEWHDHHSCWSRNWLSKMYAKRLVRRFKVNIRDENLRERIDRNATDADSLEAMLKDVHLLEAALVTDKIVASRDDTSRGFLTGVCHRVGEIRDVMWVNPVAEKDACAGWLKCGAPVEEHRQLGYQRER